MIAACADENVLKDTCESELEDAFEFYGCGKICKEDGEVSVKCMGHNIMQVHVFFVQYLIFVFGSTLLILTRIWVTASRRAE